ncbi:hypothetical protein VTJ83DRAFT_918 [Remersonia thermophila]|uniref:Glycoside hydrolase 131 catalytic N-terminal domain-containing protein n=1 Tax=Remersonia thermophila TaxID=72144 RepID=A0ABR4DP44_9PEZI
MTRSVLIFFPACFAGVLLKRFSMKFAAAAVLAALAASVDAAVLGDGRLNELPSSAGLNRRSWANQGTASTARARSSATATCRPTARHKNPADTGSRQGVKITLDSTAYPNGQNHAARRAHPAEARAGHPTAAGSTPTFSLVRRDANRAERLPRAPDRLLRKSRFAEREHGWIGGEQAQSNPSLQWTANQQSWLEDGVEGPGGLGARALPTQCTRGLYIYCDFSANRVGLWRSEGGAPLHQVVPPVSVPTSSNGADWHLGVQELPRSGCSDATNEDFCFSGVYIEDGAITTVMSGPDEP